MFRNASSQFPYNIDWMSVWTWLKPKHDGVNVLKRFFLLTAAISLLSACASYPFQSHEGQSGANSSPAKVLDDFCTPAMATKGRC
jgi:hypothetical protein